MQKRFSSLTAALATLLVCGAAQAATGPLSLTLQGWKQGATKAVLGVVGIPQVVTVGVPATGKVALNLPTPKVDASSGTYLINGMTDPSGTLQNLFAISCPVSVAQAKVSEANLPIFMSDVTGYVKGKKGFVSLSSRMVSSTLPEDKGLDSVISSVLYVPRDATYSVDIKDCGKDAYARALKANLKLSAGWNQLVLAARAGEQMQLSLAVRAVPLTTAMLYNAEGDPVNPKDMTDNFAAAAKALK